MGQPSIGADGGGGVCQGSERTVRITSYSRNTVKGLAGEGQRYDYMAYAEDMQTWTWLEIGGSLWSTATYHHQPRSEAARVNG